MSETGHDHALATGAAAALIDGIRCEAEHAADLLVDTLEAHGLIPPEKQQRGSPGQGMSLVLALRTAAVLRRIEWSKNGQDRSVQEAPPEPDLAPNIRDVFRSPAPSEATVAKRYAVRTLVTWIRNFAWSARKTLKVDVVLGDPDRLGDQGLDELAEFLWRNRGHHARR